MVERQKPPQQELGRKALRIGHALDRVQSLIEKPAGDPPWPTRFNIGKNITGERFLQKAVEVGQRVSGIKDRLREKALPTLRRMALEIEHQIRAAQQPEEPVKEIAGFVGRGVLAPKVLEQARKELTNITNGRLRQTAPPPLAENPEISIFRELEREISEHDGRITAFRGSFKIPILRILIEMGKKGQLTSVEDLLPAIPEHYKARKQAVVTSLHNLKGQLTSVEDLLPAIPEHYKARKQAVVTSLHNLKGELAQMGWEIANLRPSRKRAKYVLRQSPSTAEAIVPDAPNTTIDLPHHPMQDVFQEPTDRGHEAANILPPKDDYTVGDFWMAWKKQKGRGDITPADVSLRVNSIKKGLGISGQRLHGNNSLHYKKEDAMKIMEALLAIKPKGRTTDSPSVQAIEPIQDEEEPPLEEPRPLLNTDNVLTKIQIRKQEELEKRRKELREKITLTILSHIRNKILDKLTKKPGELLDDKAHILFQSAAASEEQLEKQLSEFVIDGFAETLEAWWNDKNPRMIPEKEKESRKWLAEYKNQGHELKELVQIVCGHFDIETPEKYRQSSTSFPAPESPKDEVHP